MYATGIPNFDYVISDGHEVYVETYHWEARSLETLKERISEMKGSLLSDDEMRWAFQTHWTCKKDANREANESVQTPGQISGTEILKSFEDVRNRNINRLKRDMVHQQEFT
jgi:hypothetical protein